jgi:predicted  nucleic acid-binding Zn-ribbon protein
MKRALPVLVLGTMLMLGCSGKEEELSKQLSQAQSEKATLQQNIVDRDKYFDEMMKAVNDVYADLEKARTKESQLVARSGGVEGPIQITDSDTRQKFMQNISDIGSALRDNRKKISDLQARAKGLHTQMASLNTLIDNLKKSLEEREQSIAQLQGRVQGLENTVADQTKTIGEKENTIHDQQQRINTAYYVVGTRDDLKKKGIITDEGGFLWGLLGSTTIMTGNVDESNFTAIDKTKDQTIQVNGKIEEILPRRDASFFAMAQPQENRSELNIKQPDGFWQSKYLVIVVD